MTMTPEPDCPPVRDPHRTEIPQSPFRPTSGTERGMSTRQRGLVSFFPPLCLSVVVHGNLVNKARWTERFQAGFYTLGSQPEQPERSVGLLHVAGG
jgi:hypothetical protein